MLQAAPELDGPSEMLQMVAKGQAFVPLSQLSIGCRLPPAGGGGVVITVGWAASFLGRRKAQLRAVRYQQFQ